MTSLSSDAELRLNAPQSLSRFERIKRRFGTDWWHVSFLLDYLLTVIILVMSFVLTRSKWIEPYHRYLPPDDPSHAYPLVPEIVPLWALMVFCFAVPYSLYTVYWLFAARSLHDLHHSMLGTAESISLTVLCTQSLKVFAGEYRPNWANDNNMVDGRESFPSGHSAVAFASMTFLSLWLCARMGIFRKRNGHIWQMLLALSPYAAAGAIAVSRTRDYHHTFSDITAGALIGVGVAVFNYFLKYPPLWKRLCAEPKHRRPVMHDSMFPEL